MRSKKKGKKKETRNSTTNQQSNKPSKLLKEIKRKPDLPLSSEFRRIMVLFYFIFFSMVPHFELIQDETCLSLQIRAKYLRQQDMEFYFGEKEFRFFCPPFSLHLEFDKCIEEDGTEKAMYCLDTGVLSVRIPKKNKGEVFADLDCLSKLIKRSELQVDEEDAQAERDEERSYYGFNNHYNQVFRGLEHFDVLELDKPETTSASERKMMRVIAEEVKFDADYYLADLFNEEDFAEVLGYQPWWNAFEKKKIVMISETDNVGQESVKFEERDQNVLLSLKPKMYILENESSVQCGLVDLLFAYCYNEISNMGNENCEASWTISRLSRLLSWLDAEETDLENTLVCCFRRALAYPLIRNWKMCCMVKRHVEMVLNAGKSVILKCLLGIYHTMTHNSEKRYLLNVVFVNDYLIWVQMTKPEIFELLSKKVASTEMKKSKIGFDLDQIEEEALKKVNLE